MTITPGVGQTAYSRNQGEQRKGRPSTLTMPEAFPAVNPILAKLGNLLFGGAIANGNYDTTIVDDITGESTLIRTVRAGGIPVANADLATQHVIDLNAAVGSILVATVNGTTPEQVDLVFIHNGRTYTVSTAVTGGGTLVFTETQAPGGSVLNIGSFVRYGTEIGGQKSVRDLVASSLAADVIGFTMTPLAEIINQASTLATAVDQFLAGDMLSVAYRGKLQSENVGGAGSDAGFVFVVVSTAGGDEVGEMRADADGTAHVVEASPTAANDTAFGISINLIDLSTLESVHSQVYVTDADGTATDAEITDALIVLIDASVLVTTHGVSTANVSDDVEVTAPVGFRLDIQDAAEGPIVVAEITALVQNTIRLPKAMARLDQDIAGGVTGRIYINTPA